MVSFNEWHTQSHSSLRSEEREQPVLLIQQLFHCAVRALACVREHDRVHVDVWGWRKDACSCVRARERERERQQYFRNARLVARAASMQEVKEVSVSARSASVERYVDIARSGSFHARTADCVRVHYMLHTCVWITCHHD